MMSKVQLLRGPSCLLLCPSTPFEITRTSSGKVLVLAGFVGLFSSSSHFIRYHALTTTISACAPLEPCAISARPNRLSLRVQIVTQLVRAWDPWTLTFYARA
jgi:hypothetical protein